MADSTYQHDVDARPLCEKQFEIALTNRRLFGFNEADLVLSKTAINNFLQNMHSYVKPEDLAELNIESPKLHVGIITSGDQFIEDIDSQKNFTIDGVRA